jgi:hypothetical protein
MERNFQRRAALCQDTNNKNKTPTCAPVVLGSSFVRPLLGSIRPLTGVLTGSFETKQEAQRKVRRVKVLKKFGSH